MPGFLTAMAEQTATTAANATLGTIFGAITGKANDRRQIRQQTKLQDLQIKGSKELSDYNYKKQMEMWEQTNYKAQMEQLKKAGLNPGLIYGMSGGGGTTTGSGGSQVTGATASQGGGNEYATGMGLALGSAKQAAEIKLLEAQAKQLEAQTEKTKGPDTENTQADTANKVAQEILLKYAGKEAADQYNRIKAPNRGIEEQTYRYELEARQGIANNIYELWRDGKLKDKSIAEIEQLLLSNAKTRAETHQIQKAMDSLEKTMKGQDLDNAIKELNLKLQEQTNVDTTAPWWIKTMARFIQSMF